MNYIEFKQSIVSILKKHLPTDFDISIRTVPKNNGVQLDGLTILDKKINISPTIYLNPYYETYLSSNDLESIVSSILSTYEEYHLCQNIDLNFFLDFNQVSTKIVYKLINYEENKALLKTLPSIKLLDLAIVFYCLVSSDVTGNATILINLSHLKLWNITTETLYSIASHNTPILLASQLKSMQSLMCEFLGEFDTHNLQDESMMYVLTNASKLNGSACILYDNLLASIADDLNSDLYILPSSIHEIILIPTTKNHIQSQLTDMVREINETQLSKEEILSNHVYLFSREKSQILI